VIQALARVRKAAQQRKKEKFTALFHHLSVDLLREAFLVLKRDAAPGMDGLTWQAYAADRERNLTDLHARVHRGAYRATPSRRTYIPKADGRQRPLAVAALEDKIVQRATVAVLNCIYEEEFLGFSYGFRPKRGQHDALDALAVGITDKKVSFILDADVRSFFDEVSQRWLIRFVEHRVGDPRIIRLIQKWLKAGVLEDGVVTVSEKGTGQGSVISPLLANVYLHYVFDLWAERWRRHEATGGMMIVRYADDIVIGFAHEVDARRFWDAMRKRFEEFALSLHPEKTRLIEFGRQAANRRERSGLGRPETFNFLGFTHICGRSRHGKFLLKRKSRRDRMRGKLKEIKEEMRRRMHQPIPEQGRWLAQVVRGYFAYHAVRPTRRRSEHSAITWLTSGAARYRDAASEVGSPGSGSSRSLMTGSLSRKSFIHGRSSALPSDTRGRSRMPELGSYGSVRGAAGNSRPLYVADCLANKHILLSSEENGEPLSSLWRMSLCGRLGPVFQAPLFRLDGILGRARA
jgi:group II intron reverse transcriptase/maturase